MEISIIKTLAPLWKSEEGSAGFKVYFDELFLLCYLMGT